MAALTPVKAYGGEFSGEVQEYLYTFTPASASDTITFTLAANGFDTIVGIVGAVLTGGQDANLMSIHPSFSGLVVTVVTLGADGAASSDWTGAAASITLLVKKAA